MGIGLTELLVILFIVVLVFGPSRLEGIGSSLGKAVRGFKQGIDGNSNTEADAKKVEDKKV